MIVQKYQNMGCEKMSETRHLDGTGKGEFLYNYKQDILTFKIRDRDYKMSIEFQNFSIDIDSENYPTGIRIFDASKISGLNKIIFKNLIHGEFKAAIENNIVSVRLQFVGKMRNKPFQIFPHETDFTQQFSAPITSKKKIEDSTVTVPNIVM
jgi:hypothetical protein